MKSFLKSLLAILILGQVIKAQESDPGLNHSNGLSFYFINGYAVSYKFRSTGNSAYRLHVDLNLNMNRSTEKSISQNSNSTTGQPINSYTSDNVGTYERNSFGIIISPQYFYKIYSSGIAKIYSGGGPFLGYSYLKQTSDQSNFSSNDYFFSDHSTLSQNSYSAGLKLFIGTEGAISKVVSIFAETQVSVGHSWSDRDTEGNSFSAENSNSINGNSSAKSWFIELTNVKLGVGIYF